MKHSSHIEAPEERAFDSFGQRAKTAHRADLAHAGDVKVTKEGGFDTPAGTRGSRPPTGPVQRWADKEMARRLVRRFWSTFLHFDVLLLTTIGRKSGAERTIPVCWFPGKDGSWLIVASAGGTAGNPAWYYNIAAHPDRVQIEVDGRKLAVTAEQLHGADRAEAWQQITAAAHRYAAFQRKTDRELPVIRLRPRSGSEAPP
jgi:deazaflavin-dependent oxidoreductase (nitroreductase family)